MNKGLRKYRLPDKYLLFTMNMGTGLLVFLSFSLWAQERDTVAVRFASGIKAEELKKHLLVLASDEYEGREAGERGQKMAAEYISSQFKKFGIPPINEKGYYQEFPLLISGAAETRVTINNKPYEQNSDFFVLPGSMTDSLNTEHILFMGYGIKEGKYNDFRRANGIKGKPIMIFSGEPMKSDSSYVISGDRTPSEWTMDYRKKIDLFQEEGASVLFISVEDVQTIAKLFSKQSESKSIQRNNDNESSKGKAAGTGVIFISSEMANEMLYLSHMTVDDIKTKINELGKPYRARPKASIHITYREAQIMGSSENVLAYIEGKDMKSEVLIITAHYDHLGKQGDKIFNGADDDGSGTVALLEIANVFMQAKAQGKGARRSILIMTVSGEEKGLLGSKYYVDNPVFPLENTIADLNIDMIGRMDEKHKNKPNYVYIIGSDKLSSELHRINEQANKTYSGLELDYSYNDPKDPNRFYYRSDHYSFAEKKVPIIFYFNGVHEDYHKETDEVDKINFKKIEGISRLVFYTAWELANRDKRIIVDSNKE